MGLFYSIVYSLGVTLSEQASETHGHLIAALIAREEHDRTPPVGGALDLGCGAGRPTVDLARRGWRAVGVDDVPKAAVRGTGA